METVGVILDAQGADRYLNTLTQATAAETRLAAAAAPAVAGVNALDDKANAAAGNLDDLGDAAKKGGKGAEDLGEKSKKGADGLSFLERTSQNVQRRITELAVDGFAKAGQAVLKFVGDSIGAAGDFESGMNRFAAVTGDALQESGKSVQDFKELFIGLGRDLPVSTKDVENAAIEMAKGGIEPATIAAGGLKTVLDLAAAGEVGIAEAAEIASKQLGVWVDSAASADEKARFLSQSADLLSQAANASTVGVDTLALGLASVGKIADIAGLSFKETVQTMAVLSPGFSSAADAGTSLKTMLISMQPQTQNAIDGFAKLNLLTEQGTSKFYDATGSFIGMEKASALLHASLEGLSQAEQTAALKAAFGTDAFRAAAILAEKGADGYNAMGESMGKAGSAAQQAAKRQQGFNTALDNVQGSLEAFQLTVGGAVLPVLTKLLGRLASGVNAITEFADATIKGESYLSKIASTANEYLMPAVAGVTAALIAYAAANATLVIPGLIKQGLMLALNTAEWIANGVATFAAAAPVVAIGLAIAAVTLKIQQYHQQLADATDQLLESKKWWTESSAALDAYAQSATYVQQITGEQESALRTLRSEIESGTKALGDHSAAYETFGAASGYTRESLDAEMQSLIEKKNALIQNTNALNDQVIAYSEQHLRSMDSIEDARAIRDSQGEVRASFLLTDEVVKQLADDMVTIRDKGQTALGELATMQAGFNHDMASRQQAHEEAITKLMQEKADARTKDQKDAVDERINAEQKGYAQQQADAARAYAEQAAMQRTALGEQLLAYTENQRQMGRITGEQAGQIREETIKHFGLMRDSAAVMFGDMTNTIDRFASGAIADSADVGREFGRTEDAAVKLREKANELKDKYIMELVADIDKPGANLDEIRKKIEDVPRLVEVEINVREKHYVSGDGDHESRDGMSGSRAVGGPVEAGRSYLVGEKGPEIVVPDSDGMVMTASQTRRAMASAAQLGALSGAGSISNQTIINVDARGSSLTMADVTAGVTAGLNAAGRSADVQIRAGG